MKRVLIVAFVALVALAALSSAEKSGAMKAMRATSTFVTTEPGVHRFCIPIGKYAQGTPQELSLHSSRCAKKSTVKLDSNTDISYEFSKKKCEKSACVWLVRNSKPMDGFEYGASELVKAGAISGFIYGEKPQWLAVRLVADDIRVISHAEDVCKSVLGIMPEDPINKDHGSKDDERHQRMVRVFTILRKVALVGFFAASFLCIFMATRLIIRRCCCPAPPVQDSVELGPVSEDQEARDLALAIERSLADEQKVVEVPQTAAPQFYIVPSSFQPGAHPIVAPGATPYVPMFAPQFMNYSLAEEHK